MKIFIASLLVGLVLFPVASFAQAPDYSTLTLEEKQALVKTLQGQLTSLLELLTQLTKGAVLSTNTTEDIEIVIKRSYGNSTEARVRVGYTYTAPVAPKGSNVTLHQTEESSSLENITTLKCAGVICTGTDEFRVRNNQPKLLSVRVNQFTKEAILRYVDRNNTSLVVEPDRVAKIENEIDDFIFTLDSSWDYSTYLDLVNKFSEYKQRVRDFDILIPSIPALGDRNLFSNLSDDWRDWVVNKY